MAALARVCSLMACLELTTHQSAARVAVTPAEADPNQVFECGVVNMQWEESGDEVGGPPIISLSPVAPTADVLRVCSLVACLELANHNAARTVPLYPPRTA